MAKQNYAYEKRQKELAKKKKKEEKRLLKAKAKEEPQDEISQDDTTLRWQCRERIAVWLELKQR
ncbi:hypothetical protein [Psychrosphaera algicola]|uniref:Uncharacterized protein n=1 Tax=Psychrosphaera algicola TaxID=3023714 RepID=A0ABT5FHH0_9GAMM|nr:hypothetical protein [Psychrosphaera sp. G1-22]MDC2890645.1 hypothetical protein [Psychrosphaera sp. G1-22]